MKMVGLFKLILYEDSLTAKAIFTNDVGAVRTDKFFLAD